MKIVLGLLLSIILVTSMLATVYADPIRTSDNQKKRQLFSTFSSVTQNHFCDIGKVWIQFKNTTGALSIYNSTSWCGPFQNTTAPPPAPLVEICNNGIDDDKDGQIDEGCTVNPPPSNTIPVADPTKNVRIGLIADVDDNSGLDTQLKIAKKYGVQYLIIAGDLDYNSIANVFKRLEAQGFTKANTIIADGNHDSCSDIRNWLSVGSCNYEKYIGPNKNIAVQVLKGSDVSCSSQQFIDTKDRLESGDYIYALAVIHEPFVTVKSDHGPNGGFSCWNPLFQDNGVNQVVQGHNHNYQYSVTGKTLYGVYGTGTHDEGSDTYPCGSNSFNFSIKCITGTNGITIEDVYTADNGITKKISGWYVSNSDKLLHSFVHGGN